ncbi:hypothetical protein CLAIMM_01667 [Cladophialophora immunda]|nr:hypothetical protein CLAIMM_01667 [Cladophialophora immunda]
MASSNKAVVEIPNSLAGRRVAGNSMTDSVRKFLAFPSGASSLQQSEDRERYERSYRGPDPGRQEITMPGDFLRADLVHPTAGREPITAPQAKGMEGDKAANTAPKRDPQLKVAALARENDRLEQELEAQQEVLERCQSEHQVYVWQTRAMIKNDRSQIANLQRELQKLRHEKEGLLQNLESCKDRIFNMLPVEGMADTQLQNQYSTLCKTIEYWLDTQFGNADGFIAALASVGKKRGRGNLVMECLTESLVNLVDENRNLEIPIMQGLVYFYLHEELLTAHKIFPGLDQGTEECLGMVIDGLNALKPAKDKDAIVMWRVDLQRSLNVNEGFKDLREERLSEIESDIMHCPMLLKERGLLDCSKDPMACRQIVKEAADLANNIRQSTAEYEFDFTVDSQLIEEKVKDFMIIDCDTGSTLGYSAVPVAGPGGRVGHVLFLVYPAFVRKSADSSKRIVLVKPTIVVKFDQPVRRGKKSKSSH